MKKLSDVVFDHDAPYEKVRELNKGVKYVQNKVIFNSSFKAIKLTNEYLEEQEFREFKKEKAIKATKKAAAKKRRAVAKDAGDKLKGFKKFDAPDKVQNALNENEQARQAEELA